MMSMFKSKKIHIGKLTIFSGIVFTLFCTFFTNGCYYDNKDYLYPVTSCSDTISPITYSGSISSIMNAYCVSCHSGSNPSKNISLTTYAEVKAQVAGSDPLLHSIQQDGSVTAMPQGGGKLDDCKLQAITLWIKAGMPQ